jgi:hypothetical protein
VPEEIRKEALARLPADLVETYQRFVSKNMD